MQAEWDVPFELVSPAGTLPLNQATAIPYAPTADPLYYFQLDHMACSASPGPLRSDVKPAPQVSASILQGGYKVGYSAALVINLLLATGDRPHAMCGDARIMLDTLLLHANALLAPSVADLFGSSCRLKWTPSPVGEIPYGDQRMLDRIQTIVWPVPTFQDSLLTVPITFGSPFAYQEDATQQTETVLGGSGGEATCTNAGNNETFPVFKVYGPFAQFTLINETTGLQIVYDSALPGAVVIGGGDYLEISTSRDVAYLNGDVANRISGIDVLASQFFTLAPGENVLSLSGADSCDVLFNNGWA